MNNQRGSIGGLDFIFAGFPQFACQTDQWGSRWFDRGHLRVSHRLGQDSPAEPAEWISPLHQHVRAPPSLIFRLCTGAPSLLLLVVLQVRLPY